MNEGDEGCDVLYFVGLKMPEHVPLHVGRQLGLFGHELLYFVFAKNLMPRLVNLEQAGDGLGFGNHYQGDVGWYGFFYLIEVFGN